MKRKRGGNVLDFVHVGGFGLRESAAGVRGQGFEISARAFGVQHAERERRFAAPGHSRNRHELAERDIHVDVFKVMHACAAYYDFIGHFVTSVSF